MLDAIKGRRERDDEGFTLIELMVVLLIIAILMAIAIPTFLGARNTANARAAQSNLTNALTAEQTYWTNNQTFGAISLSADEPAFSWETAWTTSVNTANEILVSKQDQQNGDYEVVVLTDLGKDGNCWSVAQINDPNASADSVGPDGTYYAAVKASSGACSSPTAPAAAATTGSAGSNVGTNSNSSTTWYTSF
jgi:type IV pilus assembly protein PilA